MHIHTVDNQRRVLFRLLRPNNGVNYHDMPLAVQPDGTVRATDIYVYATGEFLSETLRNGYLHVAAESSKLVLAELPQKQKEHVANLPMFHEMLTHLEEGRHQQLLDAYKKLPASVKKEKHFLILRLSAAANIDEEKYREALIDLQRLHPKDPALVLLSFNHFFMLEQYDKARDCADRIDKLIGGDPYLDILRAHTYLMEDDFDTAEELARQAIGADDTLSDGYWVFVNVSLETKDFQETSRWLTLLERKFNMEFHDFTTIPDYAEYVESPEYQEWLRSREGSPKSAQE